MNGRGLRARVERLEARLTPPEDVVINVVYVDYIHDPPEPDVVVPVYPFDPYHPRTMAAEPPRNTLLHKDKSRVIR